MRDWASPVTCALLTCASLMAMPSPAVADDLHLQPGIFSDPEFDPTVTVGTSASHVSGVAHEYVFANNGAYKLSQLDWQINDVLMLNAQVAVRLTPWLSFQLSGGTKMAGSSHLDDYDWLVKGKDWSEWSDHPDTSVTDVNRIDVSGNLSLFRHPNFSLDAIGGVRWNQWGFHAYGGHYIYTDATNGYRGNIGDFASGTPGIDYKQNLITPYLGLQLNVMFERFSLDASVLGSPFATAHNYDQHELRGLLFQDSFHNGNYLDYKLGGAWAYSEKVSITANWERETYSLTKGSTTISSIGTGVNGTGGKGLFLEPGPSAGFDNSTDRYSVGLTYSLY